MDTPWLPAGSPLEVFTAEERPDLWDRSSAAFTTVWPEYNNHGNHTSTYFGTLIPRFPHLQFVIFDREADRPVARGRTIPFCWDGSLADLPGGIDAVGLRAVGETDQPNALSALAAEVVPDLQGGGISATILQSMAAVARNAGLSTLVAPVRPSLKDRYPLIPIERYAAWSRPDGLPFDAWLRVHARLGATILRPEPESMLIEASVAEWEEWTQMDLPEDGQYVFPQGLAPLRVADGVGSYWEPNVWMQHPL